MRAFRKHQGLAPHELSDRAGAAVSFLSEIERGRKAGSTSAMARIANSLGTTVDALLNE